MLSDSRGTNSLFALRIIAAPPKISLSRTPRNHKTITIGAPLPITFLSTNIMFRKVWYDAYNKTKHDRDKHFAEATLLHCINAVVACLVMHCVKFSPYQMFNQNNTFSALINQHFSGNLVNLDYQSFYLFG